MKTRLARLGDERGSILLHVMVTAVLVSIIAAGIMRLALFRSQMAARGAIVLEEKRDDTGALATVASQWSTVPGVTSVCSGPPPGWTGCSNPGNCACTCTGPAPNAVTVQAACVPGAPTSAGCPAGNACRLTIVSADRTQ